MWNKLDPLLEWMTRQWLAEEARPYTRKEKLFGAGMSILLLGIAGAMIIYATDIYAELTDFYARVATNKDNPVAIFILVVIVFVVGYLAHRLKVAKQRLYGLIEVALAIVFSANLIRNANLLDPLPALAALIGGAFFVQRGLSNMSEGKVAKSVRDEQEES